MNNISYSFLITSFAGFSTLIGTILIFLKFTNKDGVVLSSLAFASGVMLTISIMDLIPSAIDGFLRVYYFIPAILLTIIFIILGMCMSILINKYIPDIANIEEKNKGLFRVGLISMAAIIFHNIPEGIATFMTSTQNIELGISLAIAIALHNIPEGISISVPIYYSTKSKFKAFWYTFISGLSEPLGAIIAYLFLSPYMNNLIMSLILAIIAGIMSYISLYELIPASLKYNNFKSTIKYFLIGGLFMIICHFVL
jgi:ZIP family zinc transporter